MDSTTELTNNFNSLLKASFPFLLKAGLTVGDDEWDDFVELTFEITVSIPVEEKLGRKIEWRYGTWNKPGECGPQLMVETTLDQVILVGEARLIDDLLVLHYEERSFPKSPLRFVFREFRHPLNDIESAECMNYVLGEIGDNYQSLPVGTRVCVPINECEFDIE